MKLSVLKSWLKVVRPLKEVMLELSNVRIEESRYYVPTDGILKEHDIILRLFSPCKGKQSTILI